jgi:hypothetical protein
MSVADLMVHEGRPLVQCQKGHAVGSACLLQFEAFLGMVSEMPLNKVHYEIKSRLCDVLHSILRD